MSSDSNLLKDGEKSDTWQRLKLVDCTIDRNISYGIVQPGKHVDNGIPIIRVNNVNNGDLNLTDVLKVSPAIEQKYQRTRLKGGEVLLTLVGSTGQSFVAPKELAGWNVPRAIAVIRVKPEIGAHWVNLFLQSQDAKHFLDVRANTTVQKTLNLKDVRDIEVLIPPTSVKKQIENNALSLENKIKLNRQTNQTLEAIAQAIFKSWFVDFDPVKAKITTLEAGGSQAEAEQAAMMTISAKSADELAQMQADDPEAYQQLAETAALFPAKLVESELGLIPEGWEVDKVKNIVTRIKPKKRYTKKQVENTGNVPVYEQGSSILLGFHNDLPGLQASARDPIFIFGDHTCVMHLSCNDFDISANVIPLKGCKLPTVWTYYALQGKQTFQEYRRHWSELIIKNLITPSEAIAKYYSDIVTHQYLMIEFLNKQNQKLEQIRVTLLPKLLSGEIDLSQLPTPEEIG